MPYFGLGLHIGDTEANATVGPPSPGPSSGFNISTRDTESNILASTPSNPSGEVTIAFGTDTYELYVWDGSAWSIYSDDTGSSFQNRWAASFDGSDDYLTLTSAPSTDFNFGTGDFGLSMWVKADSISSPYHTVLGSYDNSANNWQVFVGSAGLNIWNGALKGGGTINAGAWYNCVVTRSSGVLKTYINGQENSSDTLTTSFTPSTSSSTVIGGFDGSSTWPRWNGLIDEVAIFGAGLSASNVTDIYNSGVPNDISSLSLLGYWRMGDHSNDSPVAAGSITGITDSSGNGNDATQGTASAQPTFSDLTGSSFQNRWAASFDGSDEHMTIGTNVLFNTGSAFSYSGWVKLDSYSPTYQTIAQFKTNHSNGFKLLLSNAVNYKGLNIGSDDTSNMMKVRTAGDISSTFLNWTHIAMTYNGSGASTSSNYKIYINGSEVSTSSNGNLISFNNVNTIGAANNGASFPTNGLLDEIAIFNAELTSSNVTSIYNGGVPNDISSLTPLGWWRMGDHSNDSPVAGGNITGITDSSGNGNDATTSATSQPTFSDLTGESIYV